MRILKLIPALITAVITCIFVLVINHEFRKQSVINELTNQLGDRLEETNQKVLLNYTKLEGIRAEIEPSSFGPDSNFGKELFDRAKPLLSITDSLLKDIDATSKEVKHAAKSLPQRRQAEIDEWLQTVLANVDENKAVAADINSAIVFVETGVEISGLLKEIRAQRETVQQLRKALRDIPKKQQIPQELLEQLKQQEHSVLLLTDKVKTRSLGLKKKIDECPPGTLTDRQQDEVIAELNRLKREGDLLNDFIKSAKTASISK